MSGIVPVMKNAEESPVPSEWRGVLSSIVDSIKKGSFEFADRLPQVASLSKQDALRIMASINYYDGELTSLPEDAWKTSVCRWMGDSWLILVDLFTEEEAPSDLVLFVKAFEDGQLYRFQVDSVHVP